MNPSRQQGVSRAGQAGVSLIELMVAISIGLLLLAGLATLFSNSSQSQNELRRAAAQIENGRFAVDTITQDLQLAGFFGSYRKMTTPGTAPDPCSTATADLTSSIGLAIYGYNAVNASATPTVSAACAAWLTSANLSPGSDVLVVRRSDSETLAIGAVPTSGQPYIQVNPSSIVVQNGSGTAITCSGANSAPGGGTASVTRRCTSPATSDICSGSCPAGTPPGYIRKYHVHVYFVAPCNVPTGGGSICTGATDDGGRPVPTLKRLELSAASGAPTFTIVPIAEGVEFMKVGYGVDDTPTSINAETGLVGDGAPDKYVLAPTLAEFGNAVTVRLDLLVRNPEPSIGYTDGKTYKLGVDPITPTAAPAITIAASSLDTSYRRHVYSAEIRLVNLSARKENP